MMAVSTGTGRWLAAASLAAIFLPGAAMAQTAPAEESGRPAAAQAENGEIVVTAQRREEALQNVPVAISAFGAEGLADRQIMSARDLAGSVPSLDVSGQRGGNSSTSFTIRGLSELAAAIGAPTSTATYLDGIYLAVPDAAVFELDAVERIEVLRGPQGTLYGRNATAGAINIITRQPTNTLTMNAEASYGNLDAYRVKAWVSGPLSENFTASLSGAMSGRGDYLTNLYPGREGERLGKQRSRTVRGKLKFTSGDVDATLSGDYSTDRSLPTPIVYTNAANGEFVGFGDGKIIYTNAPEFVGNRSESYGGSLIVNARAGDWDLTSITAYRKNNTDINLDLFGKPAFPLTKIAGEIMRETISEEVKGFYSGERVKLTIGGNYYHEAGTYSQLRNPIPGDTRFAPVVDSTLDSYALFGQLEYDLTDTLTAVAGLRYNYEKRNFVIDYSASGQTPNPVFRGRTTDNEWPWNIGLNFKPTGDLLFYAKVSQGYLGPGFNQLPGNRFTGDPSFGRQSVLSYEIGAKTQWLDDRLTLNLAAFYYKYKDIAVRTSNGTEYLISNAASSSGKGFEAELSFTPVNGLTFSGNASWVRATYSDYCEPVEANAPRLGDAACPIAGGLPGADRSGNFLTGAPEWMWGAHAKYSTPLAGSASLQANLSYSYQSTIYYNASNDPLLSTLGGRTRLDAMLGVAFNDRVEIYLYGQNLANNRYLLNSTRFNATTIIGFTDHSPRTYGIGVKWRL